MSFVQAMLSMAMLEAIDRSECCILLQSDHSVSLKYGIENQTLSPWIYEEISFINKVRVTVPARYEIKTKMFCEGGRVEVRAAIAYPVEKYKKYAYDAIYDSLARICSMRRTGMNDIHD